MTTTTAYPRANVHPEAQIGERVRIDPFVTVAADVVIGDDCHLMANAVILGGTRLSRGVSVFPGAVVGAVPQDLKFAGEQSTLEVGEGTTIREFCTLNRGTRATHTTRVGANCLLMAYVHVAHDCIVGDRVVLANNVNLAGHVEIGDHAVLGGLAAVHQFVKIGAHVMLGGGSLLRKDVPPFVTAARSPVRFMGINRTGLERRDFSAERIQTITNAYREFFAPGRSRPDALEELRALATGNADLAAIVDFVDQSQRGLIRGPELDSGDEH